MSHERSIKRFVSLIVLNKKILESFIEEVNEKIPFMCKNNNFVFVDNQNIFNTLLLDNGLHLMETVRCILANNVIDCFYSTHKYRYTKCIDK